MPNDKASYNLRKIQNNISNLNVFLDSWPAQIHFLMVDKCNAKCIMCGGDYFRSKSGRLITLDKFKRMASNLQLEYSQGIVLAGAGDPLLNPHLIPIIQYANERYAHLSVALTTNGIALSEEMSQALLQCRLNMVNISINAASRDVYKRIMQVDWFDRVCENVKRFMGLRRSKGSGPAVQFSSAINRLNIEDLPKMVELARGIGIESINVMYCRFYPERIRHLNVGREEDRLRNEDSLFFHQELSDQMVTRAKSLAKKYGLHFGHEPLFKEDADAQPCSWPQTELMVGFDGEIYPCGGGELHFKEKVEGGIYHFGNALQEPIEKFWNGDLYRALRISCKSKTEWPVVECRTCANRMRPNELRSHIMNWEDPEKRNEIPAQEKNTPAPVQGRVKTFPLVSVIVPTHNRPERLAEALKSILEQSYQNLEIIVINDAGADVENIISYLNQRKNITYIKHSQNRGLAAARNTGIKVARGKYIAYLDDDDLFYPNHLETLVNYLETTDYKVAYTDAYRAHEKKEKGKYAVVNRDVPYSFDFDYDRILVGNFVPVLCFMHEKSCLEEAGFFDEGLTTLEDWDLWIRMSRKFKFAHIKEITCEFSWRIDGTTMTSSRQMEFRRSSQVIYEKYSDYAKNNPRVSAIHQKLLEPGPPKASPGQTKENNKVDSSSLHPTAELAQKEYDRIQTFIKNGGEEEAISQLEKLLGICPDHSQAHDDLGVLYFRRGDQGRALAHFIQSLQADPENTNALKNLADLSLETGHLKEAIQLYRIILAAQPQDVDALLGMGKYCVQTKKIDEAKGFYEKVLKIEPENVLAKKYLEALGNIPADAPVSGCIEEPEKLPIADEKKLNLQEKNGKRPQVSIVIPVYNNLKLSHACLKSIFQNTDGGNYEIIVVDNGSTDGTPEYLKQMPRGEVIPIFEKRNTGFVEACHLGAQASRGEYLLFLNNDTEVRPGWLTALLQLAESTPDCGAVGSKLVYPDGRLQEAGGIIFADGNGWNYGRGMDPRDARFNFVREVDYCSGAALMVRKDLWTRIGGFDRQYAPAYYEDSDLCFAIRKLGYKVYYQPPSVVIHHEGQTAGRDLHSGFKRYQEINRAKFVAKWSQELSRQFPNDPKNVIRASQRNVADNILVIDPNLPLFDRASGGLRLLNVLKCLREMGFHVTFVAVDPSEAHRYVPILQELGIEVYAGDRLALETSGLKAEGPYLDLARILAERSYTTVVLSFWHLAKYYLPLIKKYSPDSKIIIDTVDIHFVRETREAEIKKSKDLEEQARVTRTREIDIYQKADRLWVVTEADRNAIEGLVGKVPIDIIPNAHPKAEQNRKYEDTSDLIFVGNFNHRPNLDAVHYFLQEVFPFILRDLPEVKIYLVGNNPPDEVKALATDNVIVTGYVEDLSPYLKKARISVNPLRYGAGMKGKIGEALSWGLPVVTTSIGAEGMGLVEGDDALIADSPAGFGAAVIRLYQDVDLWNRLSANGKKKAEEKWSLQCLQDRLESVFRDFKKIPRRDLVSIVILAHNQLPYTQRCLDSILRHTHEPFELIMVDNGSTDGTAEYLMKVRQGQVEVGGWRLKVGDDDRVVWKAETSKGEKRKVNGKGKKKRKEGSGEKRELTCQSFKVIHNETNQGFAVGNNQGMGAAEGDYLLLLNNDVAVTPGWLRGMKACAEKKPEIGIVGPMSNYVSGPQLVQEVSYDTGTLEGLDRFAHLFAQRHAGQAQPFWRVVGFCMLIKRAVVEKIGGFDGRFGLGNFEDDDFSLRARLAGFESWIAKDCFVHHFGNRTFNGARIDYPESLKKNWQIFKQKWGIPADLAYGASYDMASICKQGFIPIRHYSPLNPNERSVSQGEELFGLGDMEGAKAVFHQIIQRDAKNIEALNNLGVIAFQQGEVDEALSYFRRALEIDPDHFESIENTGNCLLAKQDFTGAVEWLTRGLKLKPEDPGIRSSLANCFSQIADFKKAEKDPIPSHPFHENQTVVGKTPAEMDGAKASEVERRITP